MGDAVVNRLIGKGGAESLFGECGDDEKLSGGGRDVLVGGRGYDALIGGGGRDRFVFRRGDGWDEITDFQFGKEQLELQIGNSNPAPT
tara:strand:+ start:2999 stop:3262 length:264 start_codon:yes stop_codon:yes gene_type:complete